MAIMAFFQARVGASAATVTEKLHAIGMGMDVLSHAQAEGKPVIIVRFNDTQEKLLRSFKAQGEELHVVEPETKVSDMEITWGLEQHWPKP